MTCKKTHGTALVTLKSFERGGGYRDGGLKPYTGPFDEDQIVAPGEIVIAQTDVTQVGNVVGRPALVPQQSTYDNLVASLDGAIVRIIDKQQIDTSFLYYRMLCRDYARHVKARSTGTTVLHLAKDAVPSFRFPLPPLPEQRAIAATLDSIDGAIERTDAVISATEQLRDSLLHQLLTRGVPGWHTQWKDTPALGPIPASWQVVRLGEVAEVVMGQSPPGELVVDWMGDALDGAGIPFVQGNAEFGPRFPAPLKWCLQPFKVGSPGDVLISVRAPVGEMNRVEFRLGIGRGLAAVRFNKESQPFGWHVLIHSKGTLDRVAQGSTFAAIGSRDLAALPIPLPPLPEQRTIAAMLDSVDESIERAREEREGLVSLKQSTADALLTGRVRVGETLWR